MEEETYYSKNKNKLKEYHKEYYKKNRSKWKSYRSKSRGYSEIRHLREEMKKLVSGNASRSNVKIIYDLVISLYEKGTNIDKYLVLLGKYRLWYDYICESYTDTDQLLLFTKYCKYKDRFVIEYKDRNELDLL